MYCLIKKEEEETKSTCLPGRLEPMRMQEHFLKVCSYSKLCCASVYKESYLA